MNKKKYLILGHGFVAKSLAELIFQNQKESLINTTSRMGNPHIQFDLEDELTWRNIPESEITFWTFPAVPYEKVEKFFNENHEKLGQLIVIGSTSVLKAEGVDGIVNEKSNFDLTIERARAEKYLLSQGANLVMSSGIYGLDKNPLEWVKQGRVVKSDKFVNMIHVSDLSEILFRASQQATRGLVYIASDGNPQRWKDVIFLWEKKGLVQNIPEKESTRTSKKIDPSWTLKELKVQLQFQNFAESVS